MIVDRTKQLEQAFIHSGLDIDEFCSLFKQWKKLGPEGEDEFYEFGKDVPYEQPTVNGDKNVLMHVHLVPVIDVNNLKKWNKAWERRSRRTSDRCLVYVSAGRERYLLIDILSEPTAHAIAKMKTKEHQQLMNRFAEIADAYIYHKVITE